MPDLNASESTNIELSPSAPAPDQNYGAEIGQHCSFDWAPEPHYLSNNEVYIPDEFESQDRDTSPLSESARNALMGLDMIASQSDTAPRRVEIEQSWRAIQYDRGYQFLLKERNGGWKIPAVGQFSASAQKQFSSLYSTNVYGEKGEIITAALAREVPKVEFFPANSEYPPDQDMADVADDLKDIWAKNNNLMALLQDTAKIFWNEDRALHWTRYELNGEAYGYEDTEEPVVPEDQAQPPTEGIGTTEDTQYEVANQSPVDRAAPRRPRGRVVTTAFGKLAHKVPLNVDGRAGMGWAQIYEDKDEAIVKAQLPWMREKVTAGGDGTGETELDRVARENTCNAVPGSYVTGDSMARHTVLKHTYLRRSFFFDSSVKDDVREELLAKFPDGALLVKAATEFAFARNECLDDHVSVGHPFPGKGQNRRALGESLLPIQDYINELIMLTLDFAKRTIAKKWMDSEAFNVDAIRGQTNVPGQIGPFQRQPGVPVDQLIFIEPTPTPQPYLVTYVQWLITSLTEQISGALPSLFGAAVSGQVGSEGVAIQRDQALQRVGCPWNSIQAMFADDARQAVMLTAKCANKDINDVIPGKGNVSVKLNNMKGNVLCYPEANPEFPESWAQKETRVMSIVDKALAAPGTEFSDLVLAPKNLKAIKSAIRLHGFVIKGADSVEKQEAELQILLRSGPYPNPAKMKAQQAVAQAQQGMSQQVAQHAATGVPPNDQEAQQLASAPQMIAQLAQQADALPDTISSVLVRGDGSENDAVEASVLFDWMNGANGRKFANGDPAQKAAFENVLLHWKEHTDADKKLHPPPPPAPPKVSFSANVKDLPSPEAAAAVTAGGIPANPTDFGVQKQQNANLDIQKKVVPDTIYANAIHKQPQ